MRQNRGNKYGYRGPDRDTRAHITRYLGLNVFSWLYRGTLEWRMKEGTTDLKELVCWPLFCGWFVETATRLTDRQVNQIIDNKQTTSLVSFIQTHMPKFLGQWARDWQEENLKKRVA